MVRLLLMWMTLVFGSLFLLYTPEGQIGFPFDPMVLTTQTYLYFLFEKLIVFILAAVICLESKDYQSAKLTFLVITIVDILDYILFYGNMRFGMITWNIAKMALFGISILYERYGNNA